MSKFERQGSLPTLYDSRNRVSRDEFELVIEASTGMGYREGTIKTRSGNGRKMTRTVFCRYDEFGQWLPIVFDDGTFDNPHSALDRAESREAIKKTSTDASFAHARGHGDRGDDPRR